MFNNGINTELHPEFQPNSMSPLFLSWVDGWTDGWITIEYMASSQKLSLRLVPETIGNMLNEFWILIEVHC